jgi:hypothetical protein
MHSSKKKASAKPLNSAINAVGKVAPSRMNRVIPAPLLFLFLCQVVLCALLASANAKTRESTKVK